MPASNKKGLHLAKNVSELNNMAGQNIPKVTSCRLFVKSAEKLYKTAQESDMLGDEEKAYVQYMKFFNVIMAIKKNAEYKKNKAYYDGLIGVNTCSTAIEKAESLASSLKNRYEEKEAEEVIKKLDSIDAAKKKKSESEDEEEAEESKKKAEVKAKDEISEPKKPEIPGGITASNLYHLMLDKDTWVLLMDVRLAEEFQESHVNYKDCINVPSTAVQPGSTTVKMEKSLPEASRDLWNQRANVEHIVLMDWNSSSSQLEPGTVLRSLKDALFKWDQTTLIKSEPLVLEGGYNDWLTCYPTLTTNSAVARHPAPGSNLSNNLSAVPSLDSIDYDLDLEILKTPEEVARDKELERQRKIEKMKEMHSQELRKQQQQEDNDRNAAKQQNDKVSVPSVDRTLKPKPGSGSRDPPPSAANNSPSIAANTANKDQTLNAVNVIKNRTDLAEMRRALDEGDKNILKAKDTNIEAEKAKNLPTVNRSLKPANDDVPQVNPPKYEEADSEQLETLKQTTLQRQDELQRFQSENKRLSQEHKARLSRLQAEEEKIEHLREMKSKEMKETADLMRMKKRVQEEITQLEKERQTREREEQRRTEEIEKMKQEEDDKRLRLQTLEQLREQRKNAGEKKMQDEAAAAAAAAAAAEKKLAEDRKTQERRDKEEKAAEARAEDLAKQQALASKAEEDRKAEAARKKAEQDRLDQEKAEREKLEKDRVERERKEKERKEKEMRESQQRQEEERRRREKEEMTAQQAKQAAQAKVVSPISPGLPVGWEKRMDQSTGRYYYIDHKTKKTHWTPPVLPGSPGHTYKAKLRDENATPTSSSTGGGGLKRSHSSPNIAKLVDEEGGKGHSVVPQAKPQPLADRDNKPKGRALTIQTEVSAAKVRNLQPTWGSVGRGLTGLKNLGNTCYMNSTLQCLSNTTPLVQYVLTDVYKEDINRENFMGHKGEMAEEFAILIKSLWTGQYRSVVPRDFKSLIGAKHPLFSGYDQQDSQELLTFLMDGLHEDLNTIKKRVRLPEQDNDGIADQVAAKNSWDMHTRLNASIIVSIFQGQFKSTITCLTCGKKSSTFDAFMYLSLPIPSSSRCSLQDCLLQFEKEEKMSGENGWQCPRCNRKRDALKCMAIWKLPPILLIHLKRFYSQGMWRQKISAYVDFPLDSLNLTKFITGPTTRAPYSLYGVSNHYGTMEGGHYTAFCRNPDTLRWHKFDDHEVYEIPKTEIKSSAAYFLFYSSMKLDASFK